MPNYIWPKSDIWLDIWDKSDIWLKVWTTHRDKKTPLEAEGTPKGDA